MKQLSNNTLKNIEGEDTEQGRIASVILECMRTPRQGGSQCDPVVMWELGPKVAKAKDDETIDLEDNHLNQLKIIVTENAPGYAPFVIGQVLEVVNSAKKV